MLKRCVLVLSIAACGGSKPAAKEPTTTMTATKSECATLADHMAGIVMGFKDPPKASKDAIAELFTKHCEADAWSADAKKCWAAVANEDDAPKCAKLLSHDQHERVMADAKKLFGKHHDHDIEAAPPVPDEPSGGGAPKGGEPAPANAPPPSVAKPPPPAQPSKAPAKKRAPSKAPVKGDPCEGGE